MARFGHHVPRAPLLQSEPGEVNGAKTSGGLLLFDNSGKDGPRMLVAHPGGPFFTNRDDGWWSIPKGEPEDGEEIFHAALREFEEETGLPPHGPFIELGDILQKNGKRVYAWAFEGTWPEGKSPECHEITLEFPKGSGKTWTFPEIDRVLMLPPDGAREKLKREQSPFVDRLLDKLNLDTNPTQRKV
jgi:predicted NUDIX family NTP pyrophosphohydrolase